MGTRCYFSVLASVQNKEIRWTFQKIECAHLLYCRVFNEKSVRIVISTVYVCFDGVVGMHFKQWGLPVTFLAGVQKKK